MKARYRLIRRGCRRNAFYCVDRDTGKRTSLQTDDVEAAKELVRAKNEAQRQPILNLHLAKAYYFGADESMPERTWQDALRALTGLKQGENRARWERVAKDKAIIPLMPKVIIDTRCETLLQVLRFGSVSTNVFLRRLHNFCIDMNWLPGALIPKSQWPAVRYGEKRAITLEEHKRIVEREGNPERKAFYALAWHLGASQSDLANLRAEDVDFEHEIINYLRTKTKWREEEPPQIRFGTEVAEILKGLPKKGPLFPYLKTVRSSDRATEFKQRCDGLGIRGVTLHSYRYAWAERAKSCGYPERFAQLALGHNSDAIHRAYSKKAKVTIPALEDYERLHQNGKIIQLDGDGGAMPDRSQCSNG
jgi:integrase